MFFKRSTTTVFMTLAASCLVLGACDSDTILGTSNQSTVRFTNAMTGGSGSLGLTVGAGSQGSAVTYQSFGGCQAVSPGSTGFTVAQSGSSTVLATIASQTLTAGSRYTIVATGSTTTPSAIFLTDTYTTPASGRAALRIINAVGTGILFDVYVTAPSAVLGTANQLNVAFNSTSQAFLDVPAGQTQVRVTTPGTQTVLGTSATLTLNSGDVRTLVMTPTATIGGTFSSFVVPECP